MGSDPGSSPGRTAPSPGSGFQESSVFAQWAKEARLGVFGGNGGRVWRKLRGQDSLIRCNPDGKRRSQPGGGDSDLYWNPVI